MAIIEGPFRFIVAASKPPLTGLYPRLGRPLRGYDTHDYSYGSAETGYSSYPLRINYGSESFVESETDTSRVIRTKNYLDHPGGILRQAKSIFNAAETVTEYQTQGIRVLTSSMATDQERSTPEVGGYWGYWVTLAPWATLSVAYDLVDAEGNRVPGLIGFYYRGSTEVVAVVDRSTPVTSGTRIVRVVMEGPTDVYETYLIPVPKTYFYEELQAYKAVNGYWQADGPPSVIQDTYAALYTSLQQEAIQIMADPGLVTVLGADYTYKRSGVYEVGGPPGDGGSPNTTLFNELKFSWLSYRLVTQTTLEKFGCVSVTLDKSEDFTGLRTFSIRFMYIVTNDYSVDPYRGPAPTSGSPYSGVYPNSPSVGLTSIASTRSGPGYTSVDYRTVTVSAGVEIGRLWVRHTSEGAVVVAELNGQPEVLINLAVPLSDTRARYSLNDGNSPVYYVADRAAVDGPKEDYVRTRTRYNLRGEWMDYRLP